MKYVISLLCIFAVGCVAVSTTAPNNPHEYDKFIDQKVLTTEDLYLSIYSDDHLYDFYPYCLYYGGLPASQGKNLGKVPEGSELQMLGHTAQRQGVENVWQYLIGEIENPQNPGEIVRFQFMIGLASGRPKELPFRIINAPTTN